jgi:hypothetical protein
MVVAYAADLYVFYPTDVRPKSLQEKINRICPDVNTVAFGRVVDFYRQIDKLPPNAILSLKPVVTRDKEQRKQAQESHLNGTRAGQNSEEYVLVSIAKGVDMAQLAQLKIGVLDILGRKPMKRFMNDLFAEKIKIKRVIKTEDFLPLLTFKLADAIFVSQSTFKKLQAKSKQNLVATATDIRIGLAVTGIYQQNNNDISQCIQKMDLQTNALLGVDAWEKQQ